MSLTWLGAEHHAGILLTAWLLGTYGYFLQCQFVRRALAHDPAIAIGWQVGGALCAGTAMWAQALLGVVAWQAPISVTYSTAVVLAAWLPAVVVVLVVQWQFSVKGLDWRLRAFGGLFIALGLSMLGLVGQSAILTTPSWVWSARWAMAGTGVFLLGCLFASLATRRYLYKAGQHLPLSVISAVVSASFVFGSIVEMHAVQIPAGAVAVDQRGLSADAIYTLATTIVLLFMVSAHLATRYDERVQRKEAALRDRLAQAQSALEDAALHDPATALYNRVGFERALADTLRQDIEQTPMQLAVIRLSLDGFKATMESFGQRLGDHVARLLACRIQGVLREGDVLARTDSDELMVFGLGLQDDHQVTQWASRLAAVVREPCLIEEHDLCLNASMGIARYPDSAGVEQLMAHSLDAMLMARKAGGGVHCLYQRGMAREGQAQVEMQRDLRHAIERNELSLHFQPKLAAIDGRLCGVEALLRWRHPVRGQVSPGEFIPVAERFGLINELGMWVLDAACRQIRQWDEAGLIIPVAVNLSAHQLRQPDLEARVREALVIHGVPPHLLIMEITESTAMDDIESSLKVFDMLDAIGVSLSIDDFGTGYSSLSYLRRLPARQLKIDRSFVRDLATSADARAIVGAVVRLAHALSLTVVAEGVETLDQASILRGLQCDELQGFLFARPMPETELIAWLLAHDVGVSAVVGLPEPGSPVVVPPERVEAPGASATLSPEAPSTTRTHLEARGT